MKRNILYIISVFVIASLLLMTSCTKKRNPTEIADPTDTPAIIDTLTFTHTSTPQGPTFTATNTASNTATNTATDTNTVAQTPTGTPTQTVTIPYTFDFETDQTGDFLTQSYTDQLGVTGHSYNTNIAYTQGSSSGSMKVDFDITGTTNYTKGDFYHTLVAPVDMTNSYIEFNVYIPADLAALYYGAMLYVKDTAGGWATAGWVNLGTSGWVTISWDTSVTAISGANATDIQYVGIQLDRGGAGVDWSGSIYVDNVMIPGGGLPTYTYTETATEADTETFTETETATDTPPGATYTDTETFTVTETFTETATETFTETPTETETALPATTFFDFETDQTTYWDVAATGDELAFTSPVWDTSGMGNGGSTGSYAVTAAFVIDGGNNEKGSILHQPASPLDLTNKVITFNIYVPAGMASLGYGAQLYIKSGSGWTWDSGGWNNFMPAGWNEFTWDLSGASLAGDASEVYEIGVQITAGGTSTDFSGTIYFDDINISGDPLPTPTETATTAVGAAVYNFDAGLMGWAGSDALADAQHNTNTSFVHTGAGSAGFNACAFVGGTATGIFQIYPGGADLSAATNITAQIYVPADLAGLGYGAQMFFQDSTWGWDAVWVNLDTAGWITVNWDVVGSPPSQSLADVQALGIEILQNGGTDWTGDLYIDEIDY